MKFKIAEVSIFILWFAAVFDPIGYVFYLRYISLVFALSVIFFLLIFEKIVFLEFKYRGLLILFFLIILPLYGSVIYFLHGYSGDFVDTSYFGSAILILTSLIYWNKSVTIFGIRSFIFSMRLLNFVILFAFISQLLLFGEWINFFTERNVAIVSFREYSGVFFPYIYFLASPMLIFLLAYDYHSFLQNFKIRNLLLFLITAFALILSGTRAHIVIAILFIPIYHIIIGGYDNFKKSILLILFILIIGLSNSNVLSMIDSFFSTKEASNSIKISLLDGYLDIFSNPINFLFGQGFNAHEWSHTLRSMIIMEDKASRTELTYLEFIRVFGIFISVAIIILFVLIGKSLNKVNEEYRWLLPGYIIFMLNASLNPYLISVNGILPLGLIGSIIYHCKPLSNFENSLVRVKV